MINFLVKINKLILQEYFKFKNMNSDQLVTASAISSKIYIFFIFAVVEIICNSISFFFDINGENFLEDGASN